MSVQVKSSDACNRTRRRKTESCISSCPARSAKSKYPAMCPKGQSSVLWKSFAACPVVPRDGPDRFQAHSEFQCFNGVTYARNSRTIHRTHSRLRRGSGCRESAALHRRQTEEIHSGVDAEAVEMAS